MNTDNPNPDRLEREVDEARLQLGRTVDAISNKLSPGQLLDQALSMSKQHGGQFAQSLGCQVKENPLALLLTGVGVSWLMAGGRHAGKGSGSSSHADLGGGSSFVGSPGNGVDAVKSSIGDAATNASAAASEHLHAATTTVSDAAQQVKSQFDTVLQEQPLIAGALGVALGASLGALIPPTEQEDRWMGGARDALIDKARAVADENYEEVKERVKSVAEKTEAAVKSEASSSRV